MEEFVKGQIVVVPFPFSDLSDLKKRPAVVISSLKGNNLIDAKRIKFPKILRRRKDKEN